ncbi:MAG: thioredoxin-related protein [Planctomycetota bacterium]|jgi:thioredoxin-related protein
MIGQDVPLRSSNPLKQCKATRLMPYSVMPFAKAILTVLFLTAAFSFAGPLSAAEVKPGASYGAKLADKPAWFKDSFLEFEEDVAEASAKGKRVMLYFYQDGCPYCARLINENFADDNQAGFIKQNFDGISINIWGDREVVSVSGQDFSEKTFAAALKVQYTPTLLFLDEQGKVALRLDGYYPTEIFQQALQYASEKVEQKLSFSDFRLQNRSAKSGKLNVEPFYLAQTDLAALAKQSDRPLAVYFESAECDQCDTLHQRILIDPPTRKLVMQADNVQFDISSDKSIVTPQGKKTTIKQWVSDLDIAYTPSVLFFNQRGEEVMRISAFIKTFHFQSVYAYVLENAYLQQPVFQRYIAARAEAIREAGYDTDIWGYESAHQ